MSSIRDEFQKTVEDRRERLVKSGGMHALKTLSETIQKLSEAGIDVSLSQDSRAILVDPEGYSFRESGSMPRYLLNIEGVTFGVFFGRNNDDSAYGKVNSFGITSSPVREDNNTSNRCGIVKANPDDLRKHLMELAATYRICNETLPGSHAKNTPSNVVRKIKPAGR